MLDYYFASSAKVEGHVTEDDDVENRVERRQQQRDGVWGEQHHVLF
jgi:hypothetical protein